MMYAYLQTGQDKAARALLGTIPEMASRFDPTKPASAAPPSAGYFAIAAMPARFALERGAWQDAARLESQEQPIPACGCDHAVRPRHRRSAHWRHSDH